MAAVCDEVDDSQVGYIGLICAYLVVCALFSLTVTNINGMVPGMVANNELDIGPDNNDNERVDECNNTDTLDKEMEDGHIGVVETNAVKPPPQKNRR